MSKSGFFWNDKKEQILADSRAEIQKHEFQADYDRRHIQKLNGVIQSQRGEIYCAHQGDQQHRRDSTTSSWTRIGTKSRTSWSSWEKSQWDGRIEAISRVYIRYNFGRELIEDRDTILEIERFSRCSISTQWTIPRWQSTSVFPTSFSSWRNAKPFSGNAEPQQWAAKYLGHAWCIGKRFCKSIGVFFSSLSARVKSMDL